jgi:DNA primase
VRAEYVKECSNLLHVNEEILYHEINKLKRKESEKKLRQNDISASSAEQKPHPVSPQEMLNAENQKFEEEERNILQVLIKYGSRLCTIRRRNRNPITVEDFIIEDLEQDSWNLFIPVRSNASGIQKSLLSKRY